MWPGEPGQWSCDVDFLKKTIHCYNPYGSADYTLSDKDLAELEKEIFASHILEESGRGTHASLDAPIWGFEATLADGSLIIRQGFLDCIIYNVQRLEKVFIETEARLRGGDTEMIFSHIGWPLERYVNIKEAIQKYPEEFEHLENKDIEHIPTEYVKRVFYDD